MLGTSQLARSPIAHGPAKFPKATRQAKQNWASPRRKPARTTDQVIGQNVKTLKDATGKLYGPDLYADMFPKPGTDTTPVAKVSFVTKVGELGCGVGYYK